VSRARGLFERRNLVVERLPLAVENVRACDDNVDLLRAGFDAAVNLFHALGQRRKACWESAETAATGMPEPSSAFTAVSTNA